MNTLTIRLDEDILQKIDTLRGTENRSEYIRSLIVLALEHNENTGKDASEHEENATEYKENTDLIELLKADIEHLRAQNVDLTKLLNQEQSLHLQTQRQIMPSPEEITKKNWWRFWK
jgi:Arc/MetJ-type ribon-helix-helix transcriptional regulator